MTVDEVGERTPSSAGQKPQRRWIVRDRRGRLLGTAGSLGAVIEQATQQGEPYPLLEPMPEPEDDSPGPTLWRRTL